MKFNACLLYLVVMLDIPHTKRGDPGMYMALSLLDMPLKYSCTLSDV